MAIAGELMVKMSADIAELRAGMTAASQQISQFAAKFQSTMRGLVTAAAAQQAFAAAANYASALFDMMGDLADTAERLDVSTDALQAWTVAAQGAGVSAEELTAALTKFQTNVGKAAEGNKKLAELFIKLKVPILDAQGNARSLTELLPETARAIDGLGSAAAKNAATVELFGKSGGRMIAALRELGVSTDDAIAKAKELGFVIDQDLITKADKLGDKWALMRRQFDVAFAENTLGPVINGLSLVDDGLLKTSRGFAQFASWVVLGPLKLVYDAIVGISDAVGRLYDKLTGVPQVTGRAEGGAGVKPPNQFAPPKGGGGKSDAEKLAEDIAELNRETARYRDMLADMKGDTQTPWAELQRQLELNLATQKRLDDLAKRFPGGVPDALKRKYTEAAEAVELAQFRIDQMREAIQTAEAVERRYGDGVRELTDSIKELNAARDTQRLSAGAYSRALDELVKRAQSMEIAARYGKGAAEALEEFENQLTGLGSSIYDAFSAAEFSIRDFVASFLRDVGRMVFQMMVWTPIIQAFMSLIRGWLAPGTTAAGTASAGAGASTQAVGLAGGRQGGGQVWPGAAFMVGERGPERFIPAVPGRIEPNVAGAVVVNIDLRGVTTESGDATRDRQMGAELARRVRAAVLDVLRTERRPGGMLTAWGPG
jgi:hypothetical protein